MPKVKKSQRHKKIYKMKGCSKKNLKKRGGGDNNLAYTGSTNNIPSIRPPLAYPGTTGGNYPSNTLPNKGLNGSINFFNNTSSQHGGMSSYPNGLIGSPWTSSPSNWSGSGGDTNYNHYELNSYNKGDPVGYLKNMGANKPFTGGRKNTKSRKNKKQKGGAYSNTFGQDRLNLFRETSTGIQNLVNIHKGNAPIPSPLPWMGQLTNTPNFANLYSFFK